LDRSLADIFGRFGVSFASFAFSQMLKPLTPEVNGCGRGDQNARRHLQGEGCVFDMP
jgi:hypothetical protein